MATKKNDPVKPKKDKWGRSEGSKYYSFNPDTKKYEDKEKQKALEYKRAAAASPVRAYFDKKLGVNTLTTKDPTPFLQKGGSTKKYKTGGMVNANASVQASKVSKGRPAKSAEPKSAAKKATGRTGSISKAPRTASPRK
jgi:hypothetical protein